jgi:hypothetical protein
LLNHDKMKKLLVVLMTVFALSVNAQNACSTKEQNDATQKICERTFEGLVGVAGAAACSRGGPIAAGVCGVVAGAAVSSLAERVCKYNRETRDKITPSCENNSTPQQKSEFRTDQTFGQIRLGSNNCSASNVMYTSKARR